MRTDPPGPETQAQSRGARGTGTQGHIWNEGWFYWPNKTQSLCI